MLTRMNILILLSVTIPLFQNCNPTNLGVDDTSPKAYVDKGRVEQRLSLDGYTKVRYYPLDWTTGTFIQHDLLIDLQSGGLTFAKTDQPTKSCLLDTTRLRNITNLLAESKLCVPVNDPGTPTCLALAIPDLDLIGKDIVSLAAPICGTGIWLCDGKDLTLRAMLKQIKETPPLGCQ